MPKHDEAMKAGPNRRRLLECMAWPVTGMVWSVAGGAPSSRLLGAAQAKDAGFTFVQISDSHIGFDKPINPDPAATLNEALDKIAALPTPPDFIIHTGDITHLAAPEQFDIALQNIARLKRDVDHKGVHFISLNNVTDLKANGLGSLGGAQLAWLADDLRDKTDPTPIVVFRQIPLWTIAPEWGWGTQNSLAALALLAGFGSLTVLNGHIHQTMQKIEGNATFRTARSTAFPQPAPARRWPSLPSISPQPAFRSLTDGSRRWTDESRRLSSIGAANIALK
jgi:3',5'-cyclic-AMP phosphodiesterase